jgi:hypothetical protein
MLNQEELEEAIGVLTQMLDGGESSERAFQNYFETHPIVMSTLGYCDTRAKPRLGLPEHLRQSTGLKYLEPDFIAARPTGLWEIVDLKLPQEKLFRTTPFRQTFYAKVNEYISQVVNYSDYFDDHHNHQKVKATLGVDIHKRVDVVLIIGRDGEVDKVALHEELRKRSNRVTFYTYDDILVLLTTEYARLYSHKDNLPGFSFYAILSVPQGINTLKRCVYDIGLEGSDRFSIYLENGTIAMELS